MSVLYVAARIAPGQAGVTSRRRSFRRSSQPSDQAMPSRMSCSLATTAVGAGALHDRTQDQRTGADDVGAARVHDAAARAAARGSARSRSVGHPGDLGVGRSGRGGSAPGSYAVRPSAIAATVVTEPASPTRVVASRAGHGTSSARRRRP